MAQYIVNNLFMNSYIGKQKIKRSSQPISGFKKTYLTINHDEKVSLHSVQGPSGLREDLPLNAKSKCPTFPRFHAGKPSPFCTCGFYSYTTLDEAIQHLGNNDSRLLMRTVASGKMLMYEKGMRTGVQRVEEIIIDKCFNSLCPRPADRIAVIHKLRNDRDFITPFCSNHGEYYDLKTFSWLADKMSASFENGEPPVIVRSLHSYVKPWDGAIPAKKKPEVNIPTNNNNELDGIIYGSVIAAVMGVGAFLFINNFPWPF